jgi:hypothetical protein
MNALWRAAVVATAVALGLRGAPGFAASTVYKCTDAAGRTTYGDAPCDAAAKPLKLPEDPRANPSDPNMCRQLNDETRRLRAEAQSRTWRTGVPESAASAKRRHALEHQYAVRCAGVSRTISITR